MELYLNTFGTFIHKAGDMFEVCIGEEKKRISPEKISSIIISNATTITTDAVQLALEHNIDIVFLDANGEPYGRIWFPKLGSTTLIRRRLLEIEKEDSGLEIIKTWTSRKISNQIEFIKLLLSKRPEVQNNYNNELASMIEFKNSIENLTGSLSANSNTIMGFEGNTSRYYFKILSELIPDKYKFDGRSSRPAKDPFNAFLNYGYGVLYSKVEKALIIAGLDPYIGLLHTDNYNKKSLVFDFIEPYRILCDKTVFYLFSRRSVSDEHCDKIENGFSLNAEGKKLLIKNLTENFDEIIRHGGRNIKAIDQILADAHAFANFLIGKRKEY